MRGIYDLAAQIRAGRSVAEHLGEEVTSRLPFRMVDLGAVGVEPDPAAVGAGHRLLARLQGVRGRAACPRRPTSTRPRSPRRSTTSTSSCAHFARERLQRRRLPRLRRVRRPSTRSPDGAGLRRGRRAPRAGARAARRLRAVLGPRRRARHGGLPAHRHAHPHHAARGVPRPTASARSTPRTPSCGTSTPPGLDELYAAEPALDGVLIRIGEAGRVYDVEGWDYYSAARGDARPTAVRTMLETLSAQAEASDREVIFRTWSVGVGAVGDMHTNPESYEAVLGGIDSPALIVSTKYTLGDFYSWLPLNDTLEQGDQRRIVEFQSRREFENFGAFPNDLGREYQFALQTAARREREHRGHLDLDAGRRAVARRTDDAVPQGRVLAAVRARHAVVAAALARDPETDVAEVTAGWARQWFSDDPATVGRDRRGDGPLARGDRAGHVHRAVRRAARLRDRARAAAHDVDLRVGHPHRRLRRARRALRDLARRDRRRHRGGDRRRRAGGRGRRGDARARVVDGCRDLARRVAARRVPRHARLRGRRAAAAGGVPRDDPLPGAVARHPRARRRTTRGRRRATSTSRSPPRTSRRYEGDVDYPAYNLTAAELGVERADRDLAMAWIARVLLLLAARVARHRHARGAHAARPPARRGRGAGILARLDPAVARAGVDARDAAARPLAHDRRARGAARRDPRGADVVPLVGAPRRRARRVARLRARGAAARRGAARRGP